MRARPCLLVALAVTLCAAGALAAAETPQTPQITEDAKNAIQRTLAAYGAKKDYHGSFVLTQTVKAGDMDRVSTVQGTVKLVRPDKAFVQLTGEGQAFRVTCNGEQCLAYFGPSGKYMDWKATRGIDSALSNPALIQTLGDMARVTLIPFSSQAYDTFMSGVTAARIVPSEPGEGIHLRLDVRSGELDVWVDPESHLVTAARSVPTRMIEALKAQNPQVADLKVSFDLTQREVPAAETEPAESFSVEPPEGATQAESLADLFRMPALTEMVDFSLPGLKEGENWRLADHKGEVIALSFWATWCPPCRAELPVLQEFHKELAAKGLLVLAVNQQETRQEVAEFLKNMKLDIPVALDTEGKVASQYRVEFLPTLYLIGRDGQVKAHFEGFDPADKDSLRKQIEGLLAQEPPADAGN